MALIGPRPLLVQYLPLYNKEQARRQKFARESLAGRKLMDVIRLVGLKSSNLMCGMLITVHFGQTLK